MFILSDFKLCQTQLMEKENETRQLKDRLQEGVVVSQDKMMELPQKGAYIVRTK